MGNTARDDLRGIYEYIAYNLFVPITAKFPLYKKEPWHSAGLRFFPVNNYVIFYIANETDNTISVIRIMYGGSNIEVRLRD